MADMLNSVHALERSDRGNVPSFLRHARPSAPRARINLIPTVQSQIIPRLHAALQNNLQRPRHPLISAADPLVGQGLGDGSAFAERLLAGDDQGARDLIDDLRIEGRSLESIYLNLLAPTACHLRDLWSDDLCGLADVTLALFALQGILRHYAPDFRAEASGRETGMRALLVSPSTPYPDAGLPAFGLLLMAEFFRREGWDAWIEHMRAGEKLEGAVLGEWFDLVEILATSDKQLDAISSGIRAIRRGSPNPAIGIIVCGQVFVDHPEFVRLVGADVMATDPRSSIAQANDHVTRSTPRKRLS